MENIEKVVDLTENEENTKEIEVIDPKTGHPNDENAPDTESKPPKTDIDPKLLVGYADDVGNLILGHELTLRSCKRLLHALRDNGVDIEAAGNFIEELNRRAFMKASEKVKHGRGTDDEEGEDKVEDKSVTESTQSDTLETLSDESDADETHDKKLDENDEKSDKN